MFSCCMLKSKYMKNKSPLQAHITIDFVRIRYGRRIYKTAPLGCDRGSASVEASLVLPVFIFAMLAVFAMAGCIRTRTVIYDGLHETAAYLAEYSYAYELAEKGADMGPYAEGMADGVSLVLANRKIREYIDDKDTVNTYVDGGMSGVKVINAELSDGGFVCLKVRYMLKINLPFAGGSTVGCVDRIRQRAYLGYDRSQDDDDDEEYVYVAENGSVYHNSRSCYHIRISVRSVSGEVLDDRYSGLSACRICGRYKSNGVIYVTEQGDKYHYSLGCSGLKRTIYRKKKSECGGLPQCSECGKR